jgi:hypothetical protein
VAGVAGVAGAAAGLAGSAGLAGVAGVACANTAIDAEANNVAIRADSFFISFYFPREVRWTRYQCFDCAVISLVAVINAAHYTGVDKASKH